MYNVKLLPDYDVFVDSVEDDIPDTRSQEEIARCSAIYKEKRINQIKDAVKTGIRAEKEEFDTKGKKPVHVIRYRIKVGKLTFISLSKDEINLYESLIND